MSSVRRHEPASRSRNRHSRTKSPDDASRLPRLTLRPGIPLVTQTTRGVLGEGLGLMFQSNERVTVDLSGLVIQGVSFSQNVQKALGTILQQVSTEPSIYMVELLFSFKGIKRVEVPEERIHRS
jgi:hypothetical protein